MNPTNYKDLKTAGAISLQKNGDDDFSVFTKRFDPATGTALPDQAQGLKLSELQALKTTIQAQLDSVTTLIADLTAIVDVGVPVTPQ